jgi:hypothetical protein
MKTKLSLILSTILVLVCYSIFSQGFQPPSKNKAVVYFVRVSSYGKEAPFDFFHQNKFIGESKGVGYFKYECAPGKQLFWATSENKEFLTANLKEGGTYVVIVDIIIGWAKAHVGLSPISVNDKEIYSRAKHVVSNKKPTFQDSKFVEEKNRELLGSINEDLQLYENMPKEKFRHISESMAIPIEELTKMIEPIQKINQNDSVKHVLDTLNYSFIYVLFNYGNDNSQVFPMYFNDQFIYKIKNHMRLRYKIFSEGLLTIERKDDSKEGPFSQLLIENGKTYGIKINLTYPKDFDPTMRFTIDTYNNNSEALLFLDKEFNGFKPFKSNDIKMEENILNPIID